MGVTVNGTCGPESVYMAEMMQAGHPREGKQAARNAASQANQRESIPPNPAHESRTRMQYKRGAKIQCTSVADAATGSTL